MQHLTPIYLALMNAFAERADECSRDKSTMYPIALYQEYRTLQLNAGRQSGKTEAVCQFIQNWKIKGNDTIYISYDFSQNEKFKKRIQPYIEYGKGKILYTTFRSFFSDHYAGTRDISLKNPLVIVDEPCTRLPELYKLYESFEKNVIPSTLSIKDNKPPLFMVLGIQ